MTKELKPSDGTEIQPDLSASVAPKKRGRKRILGDRPMTQVERNKRSLDKAKAAELEVASFYNSTSEPSKKDILKILADRGITNNHALDVLLTLGQQVAEQHGIAASRFFWTHGIVQTLKSLELKSPQLLPEIADDFIPGELLNRPTLQALFDFSIAWREPELTFEEFLAIRLRCKSDCYFLGKEVLKKDFAEVHQNWTNFLPRFNPIGLPPEYRQIDAIKWLASQTETRDYLLLSSRGAFKSSFSHVWGLTLILCLPDARVLLVSENKGLAQDFVGAIKSYFLKVPGQESRFQNLFPEYALEMGHEGSVLVLDCPMARLHLPQSIEATSISSAVAGRRFDLMLCDDILSNNNSGDEEQRQSVSDKFSMLLKLRESGAGLVVLLGTPYHKDDLYARILTRAAESEKEGDHAIACRLDPAWKLKEGIDRKTSLKELREDQVILLFPERLSFASLRRELRTDEKAFLSQNLIVFPDEFGDEKFTFDMDAVRAHIRPAAFFQDARVLKICLIVDQAFTTTGISDFSALVTLKIMQRENGKEFAVICDLVMERLRQNELAIAVVQDYAKHHHSHILVERTGPYEALQREIALQAVRRGISLPAIYWKPTVAAGVSPKSKVTRIKSLAIPLADDRLWIVSAEWNDALLSQAERFNGRKSSGSKHDDALDAISRGTEAYLPRHLGDLVLPKSSEQEEEEKTARDIERMKAWSNHIFGTTVGTPRPRITEPEPERENPLFRGLGSHLRRKPG
jgi:phage terminase large subunit-like protein